MLLSTGPPNFFIFFFLLSFKFGFFFTFSNLGFSGGGFNKFGWLKLIGFGDGSRRWEIFGMETEREELREREGFEKLGLGVRGLEEIS